MEEETIAVYEARAENGVTTVVRGSSIGSSASLGR
jgi:hypothetical protein